MKYKLPAHFRRYALILCCILLPLSGIAQLSGNYTINPTKSASNSNYQNWASAIGDLLSNSRTDGGNAQGPGVSGAVVFSVYDTVYNNISLEITAISGASLSNSITFKSTKGDSTKCELRNPSSTSSTSDYVILLNGADYVTFRQIGLYRTGNSDYATVVQITNDADNNRFIRCNIRGKKVPSNSSLGFNYGVGSCFYFLGNADYTEITQNRILYGYNGIYCASVCTGNLIRSNTFDTSGSAGMYMTGQTTLQIQNNQFRMGDFGPNQGHYTSYGMRIESSPNMIISGNRVQMLTVNSQVCRAVIIANTTSSATAPTLIYNNWVYNSGGTGDCTGFAIYLCSYINIYFNNVLINSSLSNGSAYYHYPQYTNSFVRLMNNNLINKGSGYTINVSGTNISDFDTVDYNNLYSLGTYLGQWNATNYSSMSAWKSGTGRDVNSLNVDPGYLSNSNLHISSIGINGKASFSKWVLTDCDGELRDTLTPDIGADEFFPVARDIGVTSLDSPSNFCAGSYKVKVKFQNFGFDTIKSAQINWQVNATTQTTYNWTGVVAPGASSAAINIGTYAFAANTPYVFRVWTKLPNNLSDGKPANDTLKITKLAGLSGTYSLGDTAGTDFKSFNDAINGMSSRGICGAVTFNVRPGIYNEQITFLQLPGMGSANPILFQNISKDSTKVTITLPTTTATGNNNAALQLRGADYVTFKGFTFTRTGSNPLGHVIHILNGSNHNTFSHCRMIGIKAISSTATTVNIWSDQGQDDYNSFIGNNIRLGTYNMLYTGTTSTHETGTVIDGNVFDSAFNQAINITYNDGIVVKNNTFLHLISPLSGNSHMQLKHCDLAVRVSGNTFKGANAEAAVMITNCVASSNGYGMIDNNVITKSVGKGIVADTANFYKMAFNSMYISGSSTSNAGIASLNSNNSDLEFIDNNIYMQGGDAFYVIWPSSIVASNFNNLQAKGTQFSYWGTPCGDINGLRSVSGKDINSLSIDPFFTSSTDLHIFNPLMKGAGVPVAGITNDYDGDKRDSISPDIGADEFKLSPNDAGVVELYKPIAASCAAVYPIEIVIKNFGGDTLKSATIVWSAAGVPQTPFTWTGSLLSKQRDTFVIGSFNFTSTLNPKFIIYSTLPNGKPDAVKFNDTFSGNRSMRSLPNANAGPDVTTCAGVQVTFGPNSGAGFSYVWNDLTNMNQVGTSSKLTVSPGFQTEYEIIVTSTNFGCSRRDTIVVNVNAIPVANAGPDKNICYGNNVQIGAASQNGFSYSWISVPSGFTSSIANPIFAPTSNAIYILQKSFTSSGCSDLDTVVVNVNLLPTPKITGNANVCVGAKQIYTTKQNAGSTYKWNMLSGGVIQGGANTSSLSVIWTSAGNGSIEVIETNASACKDTVNYTIVVNPKPIARFNVLEVCKGSTSIFKDSSDGANAYSWTFGDGNFASIKDPQHQYSTAGSYNVALAIVSAANCTDTVGGVAYVNPVPKAGFKFTKSQTLDFTFTDTSNNGGGNIVKWDWDFGDGGVSILKDPSHTYNAEGNYTVKLCVSSDRNCSNCTSIVIAATGLQEINLSAGLLLYPNPGTGLYTLESQNTIQSVEVMNATGQIVQRIGESASEIKIDIRDLADGVYIIRVVMGSEIRLIKVVKQS